MAGFRVPEGFQVWEVDQSGYTARIAIDPDKTAISPTKMGWRLSKDQGSPVYDVLRPLIKEQRVERARPDALSKEEIAKLQAEKRKAPQLENKFAHQVRAFADAHKQLALEGKVPDTVAHHRITVCTGRNKKGEKVSEPCPRYIDEDKGWGTGHCKACGCPDWPFSQMHTKGLIRTVSAGLCPGKAWYPLGCPINRFSACPGRRALKNAEQEAKMEESHA